MADISTMYTKDRNMKTGRKGCSEERRQIKMIFVINNLKYDTDKMEIVSKKCRISYPSDLYGSFIKKYAIETILWKSNKGNWLVTYKKSSNDTVYAEALTSTQAMSLLVQYDLETYEKIFGEIEEA